MIKIVYAATFLKKLANCEQDLREEIKDKIKLFQDRKNHSGLKVHKLHGKFSGYVSFSINYKQRIIFQWLAKNQAYLLTLGDHDIYK